MAQGASPFPQPSSTRAAAEQLYVLCFPLMLADAVRRAHPLTFHQFHLLPEHGGGLAPGLGDDDPRIVVTSAWIDVSKEPVVVRLPHTYGRYFNLTLIDTGGEPFASFGSRTDDDDGADRALVGPRWRGELPSGLIARRAPSESIWAIGRLHAHSALDRLQAVKIARHLCLASLDPHNEREGAAVAELEPPASACLRQVSDIDPTVFLHRLDGVFERAPAAYAQATAPTLAALRRAIDTFRETAESERAFEAALARGLADGFVAIRTAARSAGNGDLSAWRVVGDVGDGAALSPLRRAARAYAALGAPLREDMLSLTCDCDEAGRPLTGGESYLIHFPAEDLPPVRAFWRLCAHPPAAYDRRYGISDRSDLSLNPDGSLDLVIQQAPPLPGQVSNWLPAPAGGFSLDMRLYWPQPPALAGAWRMPPVERLGSGSNLQRRARARPAHSASFRAPPSDALRPPRLAWRSLP